MTWTEGDNNKELGHVDLHYIVGAYGYPHMVGHRASLAEALFDGCKTEPAIEFHFSTRVLEIQWFLEKPKLSVQRRDAAEPTVVEADVVLAADGIKSHTREQLLRLLDLSDDVEDTGQAAYRIMLTREKMQDDPELLELIDADAVTRWIGEKRHIIAYPIQSKQIYNLSTVQPDAKFAAAPSATYTTKGSKKDMLDVFSDFCPTVQKMLNLVPEGEVCEWKLRTHAPLSTWSHGSVALMGDACHPTLPHLAQGAAQAIEDAAVMAVVLAKLADRSPAAIKHAFQAYERVRKARAEELVGLAAASGKALHLGEGEARAERDKAFAALKAGKGPVPDKWADADVQRTIYGFDCVQVAENLVN
jgi:salicylate hydroxylase